MVCAGVQARSSTSFLRNHFFTKNQWSSAVSTVSRSSFPRFTPFTHEPEKLLSEQRRSYTLRHQNCAPPRRTNANTVVTLTIKSNTPRVNVPTTTLPISTVNFPCSMCPVRTIVLALRSVLVHALACCHVAVLDLAFASVLCSVPYTDLHW